MKKTSFFTNKVTVSVLILLACLVVDVALHRRMSRVILPSAFTNKRTPQSIEPCNAVLNSVSKHWVSHINSIEELAHVTNEMGGLQSNIFFNDSSKHFYISPEISVDSFFNAIAAKSITASVWLSISNLDSGNYKTALAELSSLRNTYHLKDKIILTSSSAQYLSQLCDSGFYTGYQLPEFNPYSISEDSLINYIDIITNNLKKNKVSSIACNYFQYPVVKKFFPNFPALTWTDKSYISLVSHYFNNHLEGDSQIKVVLYPY